MNLTELFDLCFLGRRDLVALEFQGRSFSFGELDEASNRLARLLAQRGLAAGDRLCVYLPNGVEIIELYLACLKLGVIFVPINILYKEREISRILSDALPGGVVAEGELCASAASWPVAELVRRAAGLSPERPASAVDGDAPAAIVYTSGTTAASRGATLTHDNFAANARNLIACWQISSADRLLLTLPLSHVHGLGNGLHCWLMSGCRARLLERFEHQTAAATFLDFRPTLFFGVPTMYVRLLETAPETARQIGGFMRLFVSGSAPLAARTLEAFEARFGHRILERYGMTETLMNISNPYVGERRAGSVGLPLPEVLVRLLDEDGNPVEEGQEGEVCLRGPNVFAGYWGREEETRAAFRDRYFRTGDLAIRSPDGYYTLRGRKTELIISGGFNIHPAEIEKFLEEQEGVAEAAVAGAHDPVRGQVPVAYIVPRGSFHPEALEKRCRENLASFKVPRAFICVDKLPRTALGKIQKHLLPAPEAAG